MSLFVIDLTYTADLADVDRHLEAHRSFLKDQYAAGHFLASGPKNPRTGGVILAKGSSRAEIEHLVALDPFKIEAVASYAITEFYPVMSVPGFPGDVFK